jgi:hypothetical protein
MDQEDRQSSPTDVNLAFRLAILSPGVRSNRHPWLDPGSMKTAEGEFRRSVFMDSASAGMTEAA